MNITKGEISCLGQLLPLRNMDLTSQTRLKTVAFTVPCTLNLEGGAVEWSTHPWTTTNSVDRWVELAFNPFGARSGEFFNWGLQDFGGGRLQQLREEIGRGRPAVNAADMLRHHQVLAVGFDGGGADLKIYVYDPNHPHTEKLLQPHPDELRFYYEDFNSARDTKWLTYFVDLNYRTQMSPAEGETTGCSGVNLSNRNMSGQNLSNQNFRCANITFTNFTGARSIRPTSRAPLGTDCLSWCKFEKL